jgi:membrane protein YqaA with SNARE-associated domain
MAALLSRQDRPSADSGAAMTLAQGQAAGWGATQWVAALAVVGSLAGVWLGKTLEARNQHKLEKTAEIREERRALEEALAQAELLYLRLDPQWFLNQVRASLLTTETEVAEQADSLRQQAEQVQKPSDTLRHSVFV